MIIGSVLDVADQWGVEVLEMIIHLNHTGRGRSARGDLDLPQEGGTDKNGEFIRALLDHIYVFLCIYFIKKALQSVV